MQDRFAACKLVLHPEKTKIVYCKDANRRGDFPNQSFDFLGFTFRASGGDGNRIFEAYRRSLPWEGYESPGRNKSKRVVASKVSIPEGRARIRRAKAE